MLKETPKQNIQRRLNNITRDLQIQISNLTGAVDCIVSRVNERLNVSKEESNIANQLALLKHNRVDIKRLKTCIGEWATDIEKVYSYIEQLEQLQQIVEEN